MRYRTNPRTHHHIHHHIHHHACHQVNTSPGFALIEACIALAVLVSCVIALLYFWRQNSHSEYVTIAQMALSDMGEIIISNPQAAHENAYFSTGDNKAEFNPSVNPVANCALGCSKTQLAQAQVQRWQIQLATQLPDGQGLIQNTAQGLRISVLWRTPIISSVPTSRPAECADQDINLECVTLLIPQ